ncbi:hypothetical protein BGZ68_000132 [Mortierella alpina]|nr:hypothetical protein BGZ68_000132 [Mortierella alpina]
MHPDGHPNNPQICYGDPSDEVNVTMHQDPRMNGPQDYGHPSTGKDVSFNNVQRRLDPQDPTRCSTASQLEFNQVQFCNNPQDHGKQIDQDDDTLYQEIERIRAQEEEYMRRRQSLERVCLEKEAKLLIFAGRANHTVRRE